MGKLIQKKIPMAFAVGVFLCSCSPLQLQLSKLQVNLSASSKTSTLSSSALPIDSREITFPSDMTAWGWLDVTQNGNRVITGDTPNTGCPNAIVNRSDVAAMNTNVQAINCRLRWMGVGSNPGSIYFPSGNYYINNTLSLNTGYWTQNPDSSYTYTPQVRSGYTNQVHISGQNPANTKVIWNGSCATDPNISDPVHVVKYNDIFYINGISPMTMERLTLDGQNCAGSGVDLVSMPQNMTGMSFNEMNIQNLKEVGIIGNRTMLTIDELRHDHNGAWSELDTSSMVSEVTITQSTFSHIGYAGIIANGYNVLDWWIRDSTFNDCAIGIANDITGIDLPGLPRLPGLAWSNNGPGGFQVANCIFENSRNADLVGGNSVRNSYTLASHGPFIVSSGNYLAQGNTVVASPGVVPFITWGGTGGVGEVQLVLLNNKILTQGNQAAVVAWTKVWGQVYPGSALQGSSPSIGNLWNRTYASVASIGNQYSSHLPFSSVSANDIQSDITALFNKIGFAPSLSSSIFQCGPVGATANYYENRTYCNFPGSDMTSVYNLLTFDDQLGSAITPTLPTLPPVRPEVARDYLQPVINFANTLFAAQANTIAIQSAVNTLADNQRHCAMGDYQCKARWGILFLPPGYINVASTIDIPGNTPMQIVGTGQTNLVWFLGQTPATGPTSILKLHAPAHVKIRDLNLNGETNIHAANPTGEGLIAEVTDLPNSRVVGDMLRLGGNLAVNGIGNAAFVMKGLGQNAATITGNNAKNSGYFAFFSGNPSNISVGGGANLVIQDTWYEGGDANFVDCANGESANVIIASSTITLGGWHGVSTDPRSTLNIAGCKSKSVILSTSMGRQGYYGIGQTASVTLPASATSDTQFLALSTNTLNSSYGSSEDLVPGNFNGTLDQGLLNVDPATGAQYAYVMGTFGQNGSTNSGAWYNQLAAKNSGLVQSGFIRSMLAQVSDSRFSAPPLLLPPITDDQTTDIQIERVNIWGSRMDAQFILPGASSI